MKQKDKSTFLTGLFFLFAVPALWLTADDTLAHLFHWPELGELTYWQAVACQVVLRLVSHAVVFGVRWKRK